MNTNSRVNSRIVSIVWVLILILANTSPSYAVDPIGTITTVAGNGSSGYAGDGGAATLAQLGSPTAVAVDTIGNFYIVDMDNHCVRKVDTNGIISRFAGTCVAGYSGDSGPATAAKLYGARAIAVDANGNVYIVDTLNHVVRKVDTNGIITTIAGTGIAGYSGDGGVATAAKLNYPDGIAVDSAGNLYIADVNNNRIRKVSTNGIITTVAGTGNSGSSGDGGLATQAQVNEPTGIAVDSAGNLYIADTKNHRIRKVNTSGIITTIAGTGNSGYSGDNGLAVNAQINLPHGVIVDMFGNVYIGDRSNHRVRRIDLNGVITTVAGTGSAGYSGDGGPAIQAQIRQPYHLAVSSTGKLYITQLYDHYVRQVILWTLPPPFSCNNVTGVSVSECNALVDLYNQTNGANWSNKTNWLQTTTPCSWFGVTCVNGHVTRLDLPNNRLAGSLPTTVNAFSAIQYFDVSRNALTGTIPSQIGSMSQLLYLHLAYNQLSGTIPAELGNLSKVVFFYLHNNQLTGSIPPQLSGLVMAKALIFTNNQLSGTIPVTLGTLPQLQRLHLTNNQFSGAIPSELGNALKLQELYLNSNQFSGALPQSLTNLTQMTGLRFQNTSLCEPTNTVFQNWKATVADVQSTNVMCSN